VEGMRLAGETALAGEATATLLARQSATPQQRLAGGAAG
jgi:hypothetical protein